MKNALKPAQNSTETREKHQNAPLCSDACNTPIYYTPVACTQHQCWAGQPVATCGDRKRPVIREPWGTLSPAHLALLWMGVSCTGSTTLMKGLKVDQKHTISCFFDLLLTVSADPQDSLEASVPGALCTSPKKTHRKNIVIQVFRKVLQI